MGSTFKDKQKGSESRDAGNPERNAAANKYKELVTDGAKPIKKKGFIKRATQSAARQVAIQAGILAGLAAYGHHLKPAEAPKQKTSSSSIVNTPSYIQMGEILSDDTKEIGVRVSAMPQDATGVESTSYSITGTTEDRSIFQLSLLYRSGEFYVGERVIDKKGAVVVDKSHDFPDCGIYDTVELKMSIAAGKVKMDVKDQDNKTAAPFSDLYSTTGSIFKGGNLEDQTSIHTDFWVDRDKFDIRDIKEHQYTILGGKSGQKVDLYTSYINYKQEDTIKDQRDANDVERQGTYDTGWIVPQGAFKGVFFDKGAPAVIEFSNKGLRISPISNTADYNPSPSGSA